MFIHHIQTAALRAIRQHAQPTPSLLRRRIFALYHHQRRALLGAAAPMSQERRFIQRKPYHSVIFAVDVLPFACCTPLTFGLQITGGPGMRREEVITREELLSPDILSEIVLLGSGIAVLVAFVMVAMAAFASSALQ
jgi:hypothetical protein